MTHASSPRPRLLSLSPALLALFACQPVSKPVTVTSAGDVAEAGDTLVRAIPEAAGASLVFPPPPTDREPRPELAIAGSNDVGTDKALTVRWPKIDDDGTFEIEGQVLRLVLNRPAKLPGTLAKGKTLPAAAGTLALEPAVAGKAVWTDASTLEFRATKPFDPDTTYAVTVQGLTTDDGRAMEAPWQAKFKAEPRIEIAGKTITYLPTPGEPGVINVYPQWGGRVAAGASFYVIFDQPVKPNKVADMIQLAYANGEKIPVTLTNIGSSRFEGYTVNPRQVVQVSPKSPLQEDSELTLTAEGTREGSDSFSRQYNVAGQLELTKVSCGYGWDRSVCDWNGTRLRTDGREIAFEFTNRLASTSDSLKAQVQVSPPVENLSVWANDTWDSAGRIVVSGNFKPSSNYKISIPSLKDTYGDNVPPTSITVETTPLAASVSMPEGVMILDAAASRAFNVSSRNVKRGTVSAWVVADTGADLEAARNRVLRHELPSGEPAAKISFTPDAKPDEFVTTSVDLLSKLKPGTSYILSVALDETANNAAPVQYPPWMSAARQPLALVTPRDDKALAVHTHVLSDVTLVHVARLATGEPVSGATFSLNGDAVAGRATDGNGFAVLPVGLDRAGSTSLRAQDGETAISVQLRSPSSENRLFPQYSAESPPKLGDRRGMVITDRGIYRPGATVHIKASVRTRSGEEIAPLANKPVVVTVIGPTEEELASFPLVTDDMGSVAVDYTAPAESRLGRHIIAVTEAGSDTHIDEAVVQIAEFEPPRFTVDVDAREARGVLSATVLGKYLFGAAMDKAQVEWTLTRTAAKLPGGPLIDAGLVFTEQEEEDYWDYDDDDRDDEAWSRSGSGQLAADGTLKLTQKLDMSGTVGPQSFTLEADVADTSYRHIAGRGSVVVHPAPRYAGVKIERPWGSVGAAVPVQLGVVDKEGRSVAGASVTARMFLVDWTYIRRPNKGSGYSYEWQRTTQEVGSCSATSGNNPVSCDLVPAKGGSYEVRAEVDGRPGGTVDLWAWGGDNRPVVPSKGRTVELTPDKARYAPGETAKLLVRNPFPAATAIFTVEQGGLLKHEVVRLDEAAKLFEVPIQAGHAPYVHATVTLLPLVSGDERTEWKIGAIRIPVTLDDARLTAAVTSNKPVYEPREEVDIYVDVKHKDRPVAGAEVALAVVDEGILRMTNFHAEDPAVALRPGQPLSFEVSDSRDLLAALYKHAAGDGDASASVTNTRKNFVQTAFWKPDLRTDAKGRASVKFTLPDNLTRFRMMAVIIDKKGKGAAVESDFTVRRPVMMIPIVPRFAATGDSFEAAAMVHNNTDVPLSASVAMNDATQALTIPPQGHQRVGFPLAPTVPGDLKLSFSVRDGATVRDAVESTIPVDVPGLPERPHLDGAFVGSQAVSLEIPAGVMVGRGDKDHISVFVGQHLWPELGARLRYLLDYPHGCVEQTTSSTLPLLAARDIFPRIGVTGMPQDELDKRIQVGLKRLASMRTASGGLGYWPGDSTPNVYGTAYGVRALIAAKAAGLRLPDGLLEGVVTYLKDHLLSDGVEAEVQAAIAHTLSELEELPASAADPLFDRKQHMGIFGLASLAIALSRLPGQEDRVTQLLDEVEAGFDATGKLVKEPGYRDFYYYGSPTRTKAQTVIALGRLRPTSALKVTLTRELSGTTDSYTTQATAFSLMALAEQLKNQPTDGAAVVVSLDGAPLTTAQELGSGSREFKIPVADLRGKKAQLTLTSDSKAAIAFMVEGAWKRPLDDARGLVATSAKAGPDIYRVITDGRGGPVDLANLKAGQVLRVALLATLPVGDLDSGQINYLAFTDRLPAGFEPIQPDLWTVARAPELSSEHPFADALRWGGSDASYVELRDDRVHVYFDRVWGERVVATYLVRASTPGSFVLPPAAAELMYVGGSHGYSTAGKVEVKP